MLTIKDIKDNILKIDREYKGINHIFCMIGEDRYDFVLKNKVVVCYVGGKVWENPLSRSRMNEILTDSKAKFYISHYKTVSKDMTMQEIEKEVNKDSVEGVYCDINGSEYIIHRRNGKYILYSTTKYNVKTFSSLESMLHGDTLFVRYILDVRPMTK